MIKYLIVLFTLTTLFSAQEPILPSEADLKIVRRITGHELNVQKLDSSSYPIIGENTYEFDGGKVIFHAYDGRPYRYRCENLFDTMKVTRRFFAITAKKNIQIIGLDILQVSTGVTHNLIAYCSSCIQWSELSKSAAYDLLASPKDWEQWSVVEHDSSKLPSKVKKFCETAFRFQFSDKKS